MVRIVAERDQILLESRKQFETTACRRVLSIRTSFPIVVSAPLPILHCVLMLRFRVTHFGAVSSADFLLGSPCGPWRPWTPWSPWDHRAKQFHGLPIGFIVPVSQVQEIMNE